MRDLLQLFTTVSVHVDALMLPSKDSDEAWRSTAMQNLHQHCITMLPLTSLMAAL
jgi:hypothetical protein